MKVVARNRRALYDYSIEDKLEAGVKLLGSEVKAVKEGKGNLTSGVVKVLGDEVFLVGVSIPEYSKNSSKSYDPLRTRKLLLNRREIKRLLGFMSQKGYSVFPLTLCIKDNLVKVEIAAGRRLRKYEKKGELKQKQQERDMEREVKGFPY